MAANEDTLIVYDHFESVCCHKVRIALAEKAIEHDLRHVALETGDHLKPDFLAINPKGVVPVIVHRGRTITESSIILEYLDDAFPGAPLMPSDHYRRAQRRAWARWIDDEMHIPHIAAVSFIICYSHAFRQSFGTQEAVDAYLDAIPTARHRETMRASFEEGVDSERMRTSLAAWSHFLAAMDEALAETPWLAGDNFSLADIDVVPYVWRLRNLQLSGMWANRPRIQDWLDRVTSRPSFRSAVAERQLPAWVDLMRQTGKEAWPVVERLLERPPA